MQTLQNLIDSLSRRLHCAVSLDDRPLQMMFHSCVYGRLDEARIRRMLAPDRGVEPEVREYIRQCVQPVAPVKTPFRIPPNPRLGVESRLLMPIRNDEEGLGTLLIFDPDYSLGEADLPVITRAASTAAQIIGYERILWDPDRSREHDLLAAILFGDKETTERAGSEARRTGHLRPGPNAVVAASLDGNAAGLASMPTLSKTAEEMRGVFIPGYALLAESGGEIHILVSLDEPSIRQEGIAAIGHRLQELAPGALHVGIGEPRVDLADARESLREARHALSLAGHDSFERVVDWADLGALGLLLQIPGERLEQSQLVPEIDELLVTQPVLCRTLERFLRNAGRSQQTAQELFIHRATLHYRLRRIEELTHRSLDSGEDRLALHLALKVSFLRQFGK